MRRFVIVAVAGLLSLAPAAAQTFTPRDETPEEFMRRLFRRFPEQQESFSAFGMLYNRIAYARGKVTSAEIKPMTELWQLLVNKSPSTIGH